MTDTHTFTDAQAALDFILGGNATVTFRSQLTGEHFTYKVRSPKDHDARRPVWFVSFLRGSNNEADYAYLGVIDSWGFRTTAKSKASDESTVTRAFAYGYGHLAGGNIAPHLDIMHSGICGRCGRKLTDPTSIELGIGPECRKQQKAAA